MKTFKEAESLIEVVDVFELWCVSRPFYAVDERNTEPPAKAFGNKYHWLDVSLARRGNGHDHFCARIPGGRKFAERIDDFSDSRFVSAVLESVQEFADLGALVSNCMWPYSL